MVGEFRALGLIKERGRQCTDIASLTRLPNLESDPIKAEGTAA